MASFKLMKRGTRIFLILALRADLKVSANLLPGKLVELCGIEPQTSWMQTRRSPS